jgi:hypothetical protein
MGSDKRKKISGATFLLRDAAERNCFFKDHPH